MKRLEELSETEFDALKHCGLLNKWWPEAPEHYRDIKKLKIKLKNTPEQQELLLAILKDNVEAIAVFNKVAAPVILQVLENEKLNTWECDWLPVEELSITIKCEIPIKIKKIQ